jgi:hypothetical protein
MNRYSGLCAGGPNDGQMMVAETKRVKIPLRIKGQPGFCSADYVFKPELGMWIWEGTDSFKEKS